MQAFDKDYLARREKQIQELYMLRANTWACLITGVVLTAIAAVLLLNDRSFVGTILFGVGLLFDVGSIFMFAVCFGQAAANRAIEREHSDMLALYNASMEKPKRGGQETVVRLSDDGELIVEDSPEAQTAFRNQ